MKIKPSFNKIPYHKVPLYFYDKEIIKENINTYKDRNFQLNYSVKACLFPELVRYMDGYVDGFSVSSIGELEAVKKETIKPIHFVSPLIRRQEIELINKLCKSLGFNSLEQYERLKDLVHPDIELFLRVKSNSPSSVEDERYDPNHYNSKLGIPLYKLVEYLKVKDIKDITGIYFHTTCEDTDFNKPSEIISEIRSDLKNDFFDHIKKINIGGGYSCNDNYYCDDFNKLEFEFEKEIIFEPGFDLINSAGFLIASVHDLFTRNDLTIAVLDTSVNHLPEVFEYQEPPEVYNSLEKNTLNSYKYRLVGSTCLAGDLFGDYEFAYPLRLGDFVIFKNVGAYSLVKAHTFNGIPIPDVVF